MSTITPGILFIVYELFASMQAEYMRLTMVASPFNRARLDSWLWLEPPQCQFFTSFGLIARINGIAFLIYFGFHTAWYGPILLYGSTLIAILILGLAIRLRFGLQLPSLLGFVIVPISGTAMWLVL